MIARIWHGRTDTGRAQAYMPYFEATGLRDYKKTPGNRGVTVLRQTNGETTDFLIISYWETLEDIKAFGGDDIDRARYYPRDSEYFSEMEPHVVHFEIILDARTSGT